MNKLTVDPRIKRIAEAKEIICSCIIFSIHDKTNSNISTFVIEYITDDFLSVQAVVQQYICNGNMSGKVRGYGGQNVLKDNEFYNKKIYYYYDTSSYLWDPVANAPADVLSSCFVEYNIPPEPIKAMLEDFIEHLASGEPTTSELFEKSTFASTNTIQERLAQEEHLKCFFDLIDTEYFDKKLF